MSGKGRSKAKIQLSKPELPPFLQRIREQMVVNEELERKEASSKRQRNRSERNTDDDPTIVKLDENLTEEDFKRMKRDLETQYKLEDEYRARHGSKSIELDIDSLISSRTATRSEPEETKASSSSNKSCDKSSSSAGSKPRPKTAIRKSAASKILSYDSSSHSSDSSDEG